MVTATMTAAGYMPSDSESAMTDEPAGPFSHPQAYSQNPQMHPLPNNGYSSSAHTPTAEMHSYIMDKTDIYPAWNETSGNPLPLSREEIEDVFDDVSRSTSQEAGALIE